MDTEHHYESVCTVLRDDDELPDKNSRSKSAGFSSRFSQSDRISIISSEMKSLDISQEREGDLVSVENNSFVAKANPEAGNNEGDDGLYKAIFLGQENQSQTYDPGLPFFSSHPYQALDDTKSNYEVVDNFSSAELKNTVTFSSRCFLIFDAVRYVFGIYITSLVQGFPFFALLSGFCIPLLFINPGDETGKFLVATISLLSMVFYFLLVWSATSLVFGFGVVFPLIKKFSGLCFLISCGLVITGTFVINNDYLNLFYYLLVMSHHAAFYIIVDRDVKKVQNRLSLGIVPAHMSRDSTSKLHKKLSDGASLVVLKGFAVFFFMYWIVVKFLVPFGAKTDYILVLIVIRVIIVPTMFFISEQYQSRSLLPYYYERNGLVYIQIKVTTIVHMIVLRFLIINTAGVTYIWVLSFSSSIAEILFRTTYFRRYYHTRQCVLRIQGLFSTIESSVFGRIKSIEIRFASIFGSLAQENDEALGAQQRQASTAGSEITLFSATSYEDWLDSSPEAQLIKQVWGYQQEYLSTYDLQITILLGLITYTFHRMDEYVTFETSQSRGYTLFTITIQLLFSFLADFMCRLLKPVPSFSDQNAGDGWLGKALYNIGVLSMAFTLCLSSFSKDPRDF